MKKLIPLLLSGAFMLTGSNVFANNLAEKSEFSTDVTLTGIQLESISHFTNWVHLNDRSQIVTQQLQLNNNLLNVQIADGYGNYELVNFISHADIVAFLDKIISLSGNEFGFNANAYWNSETNTIEVVTDEWLAWQQNQPQLIEPIDMDSINPDEWLDLWFLSHFDNHSMGFLMTSRSTVQFDMFTRSDENNYEDYTLIISVVGCNTSDIRIIDNQISGFQVKIQDLKNSDIFTHDEILYLIELQKIYGTYNAFALSQQFNSIKKMIKSELFSAEQLSEILQSIELKLLNNN